MAHSGQPMVWAAKCRGGAAGLAGRSVLQPGQAHLLPLSLRRASLVPQAPSGRPAPLACRYVSGGVSGSPSPPWESRESGGHWKMKPRRLVGGRQRAPVSGTQAFETLVCRRSQLSCPWEQGPSASRRSRALVSGLPTRALASYSHVPRALSRYLSQPRVRPKVAQGCLPADACRGPRLAGLSRGPCYLPCTDYSPRGAGSSLPPGQGVGPGGRPNSSVGCRWAVVLPSPLPIHPYT